MRNKLRIPVILDLMRNTTALKLFLNNNNIFLIVHSNLKEIEKEWDDCPDYRFGQLLSNMDLVPKEIEDRIWNIEEDNWLIANGYCNIEDVKFWGVNYYKNGKQRKTTKFKLLKDLDIDHIKNIIIFFEKYNSLDKLNKDYLNYFNKRINDGK